MVDTTMKTIRIRQVGSPIRRDRKQSLHLRSLGLRGIGSERELVLNSTVLGLLRKARHMIVEIETKITELTGLTELTKANSAKANSAKVEAKVNRSEVDMKVSRADVGVSPPGPAEPVKETGNE